MRNPFRLQNREQRIAPVDRAVLCNYDETNQAGGYGLAHALGSRHDRSRSGGHTQQP
jgi:hypothetical protein